MRIYISRYKHGPPPRGADVVQGCRHAGSLCHKVFFSKSFFPLKQSTLFPIKESTTYTYKLMSSLSCLLKRQYQSLEPGLGFTSLQKIIWKGGCRGGGFILFLMISLYRFFFNFCGLMTAVMTPPSSPRESWGWTLKMAARSSLVMAPGMLRRSFHSLVSHFFLFITKDGYGGQYRCVVGTKLPRVSSCRDVARRMMGSNFFSVCWLMGIVVLCSLWWSISVNRRPKATMWFVM